MRLHIFHCAQGAKAGLHLDTSVDDFTARRIDARQVLQQIHMNTFGRDGRVKEVLTMPPISQWPARNTYSRARVNLGVRLFG